jgi:ATP-dependent Clp protease ATP-binding subunit ClpC
MRPKDSQPQFADSTRQLLAKARGEADRLRHDFIGTEHLLLALAAETQGVAATVLRSLRIDTDHVRRTIDATVRHGTAVSGRDGDLPYTPRTHKVFELAADTARAFGDHHVAAEHLLIGLLRERMGVAAQVLSDHGLSEGACLDELKRLRATPPNEEL